jgi:hypothetical protein
MGNRELIGVRSIASHQEPTGEPRLDLMEAGASGHLGQLAQCYVEITIQAPLQRRAIFELTAKRRGVHAPCRAGPLNHGTQRYDIHAKHQRDSQHTFSADEAYLETGMSIERIDQGNEALGGKKDMPNALARPAKHLGEAQLDRFGARQQMLAILPGQSRE